MNILRITTIALALTLLVACGGGGSSGTAAAPTTPPTNMPGTGNPTNMPDPMTPPPVTLPGYAIIDLEMARTRVGGNAPTAANTTSETAIVTEIQRIATAADTFEFSDFGPTASAVTVECSNKSCTTGNIDDVGMLTFSLTGIDDLSLVDDTGLVGFDSNTQAVMVDEGVTMIQSQAAAGQNDGTHLTFQSYGGWLTNTVFGVERLVVTESGTDTTRYASFSFGKESGSNPTGNMLVNWNGVMVGRNTETGYLVHGDVTVQYALATPNVLDTIIFDSVKNLNDGSDITFVSGTTLNFQSIPLTNGRFESATASGDIKGSFYGSSYEEVGGIFNSSANNLIGAFGAKK